MEPELQIQETAFEKRRGVGKVEVQSGFAQVHVSDLAEPVHPRRLRALQILKEEGIGLFFLKLSPTGLSFLVHEENAAKLNTRFSEEFQDFSITAGRSVAFVHAVNMRDEEGLLASLLSQAIASGARIEHIGDLHDAVCIAATHEDALRVAAAIEPKELGSG